ncbi:uncharacterized protein BP5553_07490 [Venustampulla echinocandica]|uniref:AA1-like domain-containing protein n=1 Tax=Venustampulla echinocandica TaxID=2656787 RepID=A0A370TGN4_9HELO|nr:uncharacterized protein BP5553_07490 [Venustampulla echinocandica]RDL34362.1 hypothetical protein BP5553_07490 [Venustampulla echinocandica]
MVAISSITTLVALITSQVLAAPSEFQARQDPNGPQVFSLDIYNDCSRSGAPPPINPSNHVLFHNQQGCYNQAQFFGALYIEDHINPSDGCQLFTYTALNCDTTGTVYGPFSSKTGDPAHCKGSDGKGGYSVPGSRSIRFVCPSPLSSLIG